MYRTTERQLTHGPNGIGGFDKHYFTLFGIVNGLEAKSCFEFGMGWSTVTILEAMAMNGGGKLITCDYRSDTPFTGDMLEKCYGGMWTHMQLRSEDVNVSGMTFDFVLHDGSHEASQIEQDLKKIIPRMKKNSIICVHDTNNTMYPDLPAVVTNFERDYELITLPYGGGLTIIKIDSDFGHGEVKQTWSKK